MKVLVLFSNEDRVLRKTVKDHLFCFEKYIKDVEFHYCNVLTKLPLYLSLVKYDGIILHYTLLSQRWTPRFWKIFTKGLLPLKYMKGIKIAFPQDEYAETQALCMLFRDLRVNTVYTCAYPIDYQKLYPVEKTHLKHYFTTFTGFVDEESLELIRNLSTYISHRDIDIGYRARSLPFWLGEFGQYKKRIALAFNSYKNKTSLKMDVSTEATAMFYEDDWLKFMLRCRVMPGCLGGASLFDETGEVRNLVEAFVQKNPQATFEEVAKTCFEGKDYSLNLFALSPRHFECAMAKTCQVLLEGDYLGVLEPGRHYIELKKDFSNLESVIKQIEDRDFCERIAEEAYQKIVLSGEYTYHRFAQKVMEHIRSQERHQTDTALNNCLFKVVSFFLENRKKWNHLHKFLFRISRFFLYGLPERIRKKFHHYRKATP